MHRHTMISTTCTNLSCEQARMERNMSAPLSCVLQSTVNSWPLWLEIEEPSLYAGAPYGWKLS